MPCECLWLQELDVTMPLTRLGDPGGGECFGKMIIGQSFLTC